MRKMTEQELEEYAADLEYDNLKADGDMTHHQKRMSAEMEWRDNHPRESPWSDITTRLIREE